MTNKDQGAAVVLEKPAEKIAVKTMPSLSRARFRQADLVRNRWGIVVEPNIMPDDLLEKGFWKHIATDLRPGDRLEVLTDDMRWAADVVVHSCGRLWANVKVMSVVTFADIKDEAAALDKLRVQYRGPHHRYCVVDEANTHNPEVIRTNFDNQEDAMVFLQEYRKTVRKVA